MTNTTRISRYKSIRITIQFKFKIISILLMPFLLVGCVPAARSIATPSPAVVASLTNTIRPPERNMVTPSQTNKPAPTLTATITQLPTASHEPDATIDPYDQFLRSPDGRYEAKLYNEYAYSTGVSTIEIRDSSGSLLWTIPYQGGMPTGEPHPTLQLFKWSKDSSLLYFYYHFAYDGFDTLWNGSDLQAINVSSGDIKRLLPGEGLMAFAFSPEEGSIAYTRMQDEPRRLIIRSLADGKELSSPIEMDTENFTQAGWISWSPRGDKILFHTENQEVIQAILLDVSSMKQTVLFEYPSWEEVIAFNGWSENGVDFLRIPGDEVIRIDLTTGISTTIGTATPEP